MLLYFTMIELYSEFSWIRSFKFYQFFINFQNNFHEITDKPPNNYLKNKLPNRDM